MVVDRNLVLECYLCYDVKFSGQKNKRRCPYRYTHDWRPSVFKCEFCGEEFTELVDVQDHERECKSIGER